MRELYMSVARSDDLCSVDNELKCNICVLIKWKSFLVFYVCEKSLSYFRSTYVTKSTLTVQLWTISPNCEQYLQTVVLISGAI
jgi:hypothetical protein